MHAGESRWCPPWLAKIARTPSFRHYPPSSTLPVPCHAINPHRTALDLFPAPLGRQRRVRREGRVPEVTPFVGRRRPGSDDEWCPHLHDLKIIHIHVPDSLHAGARQER